MPTPVYRIVHVDNLEVYLRRNALHAANHEPEDGLQYRVIHNVDIQESRHGHPIECGPGGTCHDYVPFYFGYRSPMLFQLHTGWVDGYDEGQEPIVYLISSCQAIRRAGASFVFSNGHGLAAYTDWFDDLDQLDEVDWTTVYTRLWKSDVDDMDRQRRKQAEFLIYRSCDWDLIEEIAVLNRAMRQRVLQTLRRFPERHQPPVRVRPQWYY